MPSPLENVLNAIKETSDLGVLKALYEKLMIEWAGDPPAIFAVQEAALAQKERLGGETNRAPGWVCTRCGRVNLRRIGRDLCVSCYNRQRELLAAAPQLLEIARGAAAIGLHVPPPGESECLCRRCELVRAAQRAIAKPTQP